jgi:hypothetical protein
VRIIFDLPTYMHHKHHGYVSKFLKNKIETRILILSHTVDKAYDKSLVFVYQLSKDV